MWDLHLSWSSGFGQICAQCSLPVEHQLFYRGLLEQILTEQSTRHCSDSHANMNNRVFMSFFDARSVAPLGGRSKGALDKHTKEQAKDWDRRGHNMRRHIQLTAMLHDLVCRHSEGTGLHSPGSQTGRVLDREVAYGHKIGVHGRFYADGLAFQQMTRRLRSDIGVGDAQNGLPMQDGSLSFFSAFSV